MTNPTPADLSAPPGGGNGSQVIASTQGNPQGQPQQNPPANPPAPPQNPPAPPAQQNPPPGDDPLKLEPQAPAPKKDEPASTELPDLGDPGLNVAADYFINTLGLSVDSPEIVEAGKGNYSYLEATITKLGDKAKGADRFVGLAREAQARMETAQKSKHEATVKAVQDAVGGEANWQAVQNFARTNLKQEQLAEASAALSQGGLVAEAMARHLYGLASQNPQTTIQGNPASDPSAPAQPLAPHAPLTREQYREEYKKLVAEYGITGAQKRPELQALNARLIRN